MAIDTTLEPPVNPSIVDLPSDLKSEYDKVFSFDTARISLQRLVNDWKDEMTETDIRRKTRDVELDVQALRKEGKLDEDETLIPVRVIDTNIQREQPPFINYLKNSRRIATFNCISLPNKDTQRLEIDFTQGMTYTNWETPHYKTLDGAQTHGWAACEVIFDDSKPLNVGIEYIEHDKLLFPQSILELQQAAEVIRIYDVTIIQLKKFVNLYGFVAEQVNLILDNIKDTSREKETVRIYKKYCKYEDIVYVAWFSLTHGVTDWLKNPEKHYIGIKEKKTVELQAPDPMTGLPTMEEQQPQEQWVDTPLTLYPIFVLPYRETEKPCLFDHKGRVFLDENKQEAHTAILSAFVNGLTRASNIYAAQNQEDGTGNSLKEIQNLKMTPGRVFNKPVNFWHPDYPDPMVLNALQYFDTSNSQETNQVNFAAINRQDSRKTAREISAAQDQQTLLNSVQLTLFSTYIRSIYSFVWLIVQSQALQEKIAFLLTEKQRPVLNPLDQQPIIDPNSGQPQLETYYENDFESIQQMYDIRAAGDVDYVKRQEKINQMMMDWPVVANTVLKDRFLADMMRLKYPDTGDAYATILEQQGGMMQNLQSMVGRLYTILNGTLEQNPEAMESVPDQQRADLMATLKEAQTMLPQTAQTNTPVQQ